MPSPGLLFSAVLIFRQSSSSEMDRLLYFSLPDLSNFKRSEGISGSASECSTYAARKSSSSASDYQLSRKVGDC